MDFELKIGALKKDNETLERNLKLMQDETRSTTSTSTETQSELQKNLQILMLEKERD